jgi:hypothetical protein
MKNEIISFFIGVFCCGIGFIAFKLGGCLRNNGDGINSARDKLEGSSDRVDEISGRMSDAQDRIADSLSIIEKIRKRQKKADN